MVLSHKVCFPGLVFSLDENLFCQLQKLSSTFFSFSLHSDPQESRNSFFRYKLLAIFHWKQPGGPGSHLLGLLILRSYSDNGVLWSKCVSD